MNTSRKIKILGLKYIQTGLAVEFKIEKNLKSKFVNLSSENLGIKKESLLLKLLTDQSKSVEVNLL